MDAAAIVENIINGVVVGLIYAIVAVGFSLIFGVAKIMVFTHGEIYMLGAVGGFYLIRKLGFPYPLAIVTITMGGGILGMLLERFLRPLRGEDFPTLLATVALAMFIGNASIHIFGFSILSVGTQVQGKINILGTVLTFERLVIVLVSAAVVITLHFFIQRTKAGQAIRAVAQNRDAAQLQGVDVNRSTAMVFLIACAIAAAAGILIAPLYYVDVFLGTPALMRTIIIVIIGGLGSFPGAIAGGLLLGLIESFSYTLIGPLAHLVSFTIVIILLIVRPKGLLGRE